MGEVIPTRLIMIVRAVEGAAPGAVVEGMDGVGIVEVEEEVEVIVVVVAVVVIVAEVVVVVAGLFEVTLNKLATFTY